MSSGMTEIWVYLSAQPLLWLTLTLAAYILALALHRKAGAHPAVNPVLVSVLTSSVMGPHGPTPAAWTHAVRVMFQVSAGIAALALLLTIVLPAVPLRPHQVRPPVAAE